MIDEYFNKLGFVNYYKHRRDVSQRRSDDVECLASHPKNGIKTDPMSLFNLSICQTLTVLCNPYKKGKAM